MTKRIGLWIDHKKAVMVIPGERGAAVKTIESGLEKHVRYRGATRRKTPYSAQYKQGDDQIDKKYLEHLNKYYEKVVAQIRGAESMLIFGPGEAKFELKKLLAHEGVRIRDVQVETSDKMTERQITAKVRRYFQESGAGTQ
jgi:ribosomal protein S11